jgi:hypothetical protein
MIVTLGAGLVPEHQVATTPSACLIDRFALTVFFRLAVLQRGCAPILAGGNDAN